MDENNELVRDFIPAYNRETGLYGLFDRVGHRFYASVNDVPFEGPEIHNAGLPQEYTQVDFVEFIRDNQSEINFDDTVQLTDRYDLEWQYKDVSYHVDTFRTSANGVFNLYLCDHSPKHYSYNYAKIGWNESNVVATCSRNTMVFDGKNKRLDMVLNKNVTYTKMFSPTSTWESVGWKLGNSGQSPDMRLFHCKRYTNGVLQRDLIPCRRNSDGIYGLYDIVQNSFHTSETTLGGGNIED